MCGPDDFEEEDDFPRGGICPECGGVGCDNCSFEGSNE